MRRKLYLEEKFPDGVVALDAWLASQGRRPVRSVPFLAAFLRGWEHGLSGEPLRRWPSPPVLPDPQNRYWNLGHDLASGRKPS